MAADFDHTAVLAMEQAAARAWPAKRVVDVKGWNVRLSGGGSRRANSVHPLVYTGAALDADIATVEALYAGQHTRCYFQVCSIAQPTDLDRALEARGYEYEEPSLLWAKRLTPSPMPTGVAVSDDPTDAWMAIYTEPLDAARRAAAPDVLAVVPSKRAFLLISREGRPLSTALAVLSPDGIAVVECVATRGDARRSGGGQVIMDALESWAATQGAHLAVLQVVASNTAARALYARRGYTEAAQYHYRWKNV